MMLVHAWPGDATMVAAREHSHQFLKAGAEYLSYVKAQSLHCRKVRRQPNSCRSESEANGLVSR
ncbi:hypothetical protein BRAO375_1310025 [Bradyrhizobium sp. ORS 375]|nr:hypothetical protein BRAO375_1310025 [Bradyrhizobium sp. ORS 375]